MSDTQVVVAVEKPQLRTVRETVPPRRRMPVAAFAGRSEEPDELAEPSPAPAWSEADRRRTRAAHCRIAMRYED
ncbi:hypothetical protein [Kitasatospora sp. NPDC087315]|uniref:hypothetical protein n=1 Tax=Kitasatospora sp. NPDC087315 TaxID=3364069 RepID=UPI003804519F